MVFERIDRRQSFPRKVGEVAEQILAAEETLSGLHGEIGERLRGRSRT